MSSWISSFADTSLFSYESSRIEVSDDTNVKKEQKRSNGLLKVGQISSRVSAVFLLGEVIFQWKSSCKLSNSD